MHRILERQIKRSLGENFVIPTEWKTLLELINETYVHFDEDRELLDRSLELSSKEFFENSERLRLAREEVEKRIKESNQSAEKYQSLVNNLTVGVYRSTSTPQVRFLEANASIISLFEIDSKENFMKHNLSDFYQNSNELNALIERINKNGFIKNEEAKMKTQKGKKIICSISAVMKKDEEGNVYIDGLIQDITESKKMEEELKNSRAELEIKVENRTRELEKSKKAAEESQAKHEAILASIADGCIAVDENGIIILINKFAEKMLGVTKEVIGKNVYEVLHREDEKGNLMPKEQGAIHKALTKIMVTSTEANKENESGTTETPETYYYLRSDKTRFPVDITVSPIVLDNKIVGAVEIFRDITNRKKQEEKLKEGKHKEEVLVKDLEKFKLAVDNVSDQIIITDPEGITIYANKSIEKITGYKPEEAVGKKSGTLWKVPMAPEYYQNLWNVIKTQKKVFIGEIQNKRKSGEIYTAAISISPVLDKAGKVEFFVGIERDITREKEIDKAKTEFVSLASHQLRTPLTSINWYIELLQSEDAGVLNNKQKEFLSEVYKGSKQMVALVNDLLNVSRLEAGRLKIEPVPTDLIAFIHEVTDETMPLAVKKGCEISLNLPKSEISKINIDKMLLRQVINNLLTNAIQYSPVDKKSKIIVSFLIAENGYTISVEDNGIGIPEETKPRIFEKFFRSDNAREVETNASGLGLYLAKKIMESSGGTIGFSSKVGQGTTFYVTIPLSGMVSKEGQIGIEV